MKHQEEPDDGRGVASAAGPNPGRENSVTAKKEMEAAKVEAEVIQEADRIMAAQGAGIGGDIVVKRLGRADALRLAARKIAPGWDFVMFGQGSRAELQITRKRSA